MRALVDVYPGLDREDEMVAAFDYCLHGKGGAAPVDRHRHARPRGRRARRPPASRLRHRDRDGGRRRGADREDLRRQGRVGAVASPRLPARASTSPRSRRQNPQAIGCILGGHGITAWGDTSDEAEANSLWIIETAHGVHRRARQAPSPSAASAPASRRCRRPSAARRPPRSPPTIRGIASTDKPMVGHFTDADGCSTSSRPRRRPRSPRSARAAPTTSCAPRSSRCCSTCPPTHRVEEQIARLQELHEEYRADYQAYYDAHATAESARDPRRRPAHRARARRRHVLATARTSRPPASPASSTSTRST